LKVLFCDNKVDTTRKIVVKTIVLNLLC